MSQCERVGTDLLIEFFEVAFNNILYARKLYPTEMFLMKKSYATVTYVSQHPELNEYIENVLKTLRRWIAMDRSGVSAININFYNKEKRLIEKYVFNLIDVKNECLYRRDPYFIEIEQLLRCLSLKLSMAMSYLNPLPDEASFSIDVDARRWMHVALCENSISQNFPWIFNGESDVPDFSLVDKSTDDAATLRERSLLPLISIKNSSLRLELFVIEINENTSLKV